MSLDEVRQFYPNITCIETAGNVQYVINNPDESGTQFESQQILLSSDQHIVLNAGETQQIIIDQSQIQYTQQNQQYIVQENDYQPTELINNQQQIYYASPKQHVIQAAPPAPILAQQLTQPQIPPQQIMNNSPRVVPQHAAQPVIKQIVPQQQQINNTHLMVQRRLAAQNPQVTPPRPVQPNVGVRLQYLPQEQSPQQQQQIMSQDDNQIVINDGRYMTLGQFKQELVHNQQENQQVNQQVVVTPQGPPPNCVKPPPKRNYKRTNNGRGVGGTGGNARGNRGRGSPAQALMSPKPFQAVAPQQQQPPPPPPQLPRAPGMPQPPRGPIMHPNIQQHRQIQQQNLMQQQFQNRVQPLIPLSPHVHNGHLQAGPAFSPPNSQGQPPYNQIDDSNSSMSDDYRDSARMLVCLENGEQRLITFTLPKESCTVQDLLEQVGVPFNADTKIECISNPGSEIDYIVNVGAVSNTSFPVDAQQVLTVDNLSDTQDCIVSQSGAVIPVSEPREPPPPPPLPAPEPVPPPESSPVEPEKASEPPKILPRFVAGCLAVCNHCGYLSEDFNRCQRCKTRLPDEVKSINTRADIKAELDKKTKVTLSPKTSPAKTTVVTSPVATPSVKPPPKTSGRKKKAAQEIEPVVLTLSSDDEDDGPKAMPDGHLLQRLTDNPITLSANKKEPIISADYDTNIDHDFQEGIYGGGKDDELKANIPLHSTSLPCRTVRIGSYRFVPKEEVALSSLGIRIFVPVIGDPDSTFKLFIPMKYIIKVLGNFHKALPVLFFYVTPSMGSMIRQHVKMEEGSEYYFDPLSKEDPFKRITLLPEMICEMTRDKIKDIFLSTPYKMLEELTAKEANDILIRTCPREGGKPPPPPPVSFTEMRQLLIYPPGKGGIAINTEDYLCLAQDQFLNDVIIDFYLKYLATDVLATNMQEKVYIFSSFFYKRLTTKPAKASKRSNPFEVDSNLTPAEKRHYRVKSWTKNVNIFEKDYIIIPINENSHWFLAIICYPGLEGCRSMIDSNKVVKISKKEKKKVSTITIGNTTITTLNKDEKVKIEGKPIKCDEEEGSDRDEAEGDESELEESESENSEQDEQVPEKKSNKREPIKQPCILIFDSLAGASRSRVVATLRDYLTFEHRAKLNSNKTFNKDNIKGACPKVPQQMNFTDCGLYVLQYVESFFKDPITDYHIPIKLLKTWFEEIIVTRKREEIATLIKELMAENNKDPSVLPYILLPTANGELVSAMDANYEEQDMEEEEEEEEEETSLGGEKRENSLTQISKMYSSDSSESHNKSIDSVVSATSNFIVSNVDSAALKPDLSETKNKSNRDTMSYLKSKRIIRHKTPDSNDSKKQKIDE